MASFVNISRPTALGATPAKTASPRLEVLFRLPSVPRLAPPIVFVHGAWQAAWCWEENFLDYFASKGFAVYALSLRGHGESEGKSRVKFARIRDYVADLESVVRSLAAPPVLVGHSMGGFVVQKYLERAHAAMGVLMASVPPKGALPMLLRAMRDQPLDMLKTNLTFSMLPLISDTRRARASLFSASMAEEQVARYHARLQEETVLGFLDYLFLDLVKTDRITTPMTVIGARSDKLVPPSDVEATAEAYGVEPVFFDDTAHEMMLESRWRDVADRIIVAVESRFGVRLLEKAPLRAIA